VPSPCAHDSDCQNDTYCRLCTPNGPGICLPKCDGGDCAPSPLQTCTTDSDCPVFCVHGYCATKRGYCMCCT
jgi:hypothetical protein